VTAVIVINRAVWEPYLVLTYYWTDANQVHRDRITTKFWPRPWHAADDLRMQVASFVRRTCRHGTARAALDGIGVTVEVAAVERRSFERMPWMRGQVFSRSEHWLGE
jgi:hypothetical protein